jgi:MurNAc alpha-1-phosphate uridylyltransferase
MLKPPDINIFVLAAGRGKRMRPLTDRTPKALLQVAGKPLIVHHLERISEQGFTHVVINHAHLGGQIIDELGSGEKFGLDISYSAEPEGALETAGGIVNALPLIRSDLFIVLNADIWTDFDLKSLLTELHHDARLVLVDNPAHNPTGDFNTGPGNILTAEPSQQRLTFSGISMYSRAPFEALESGFRPLGPLLNTWIGLEQVEYLHHQGGWQDIGTPERLAYLNGQLPGGKLPPP